MNTIALCIPAYQAAQHLPRLLLSAHKQTIPFDEIWVYDDASSDTTSEIALSHNASVVRGDVNIGCSAAKNILLNRVRSSWIHFHDADDELLPNFTSLCHSLIGTSNCPDVILFDYEYRENHSYELICSSNFVAEELEADPLRYAILNQINPFCGLYRTTSLLNVGGYDEDPLILYNEDVAFHIKLASNGLSFSAVNEVSIINYRMPGSMSGSNQLNCLLAHVEVLRRTCSFAGERYPIELKRKLWHAAQGLASMHQWNHVDHALKLASQLSPVLPSGLSPLFSFLVLVFGERMAFRLRENGIRLFKPHLRSK